MTNIFDLDAARELAINTRNVKPARRAELFKKAAENASELSYWLVRSRLNEDEFDLLASYHDHIFVLVEDDPDADVPDLDTWATAKFDFPPTPGDHERSDFASTLDVADLLTFHHPGGMTGDERVMRFADSILGTKFLDELASRTGPIERRFDVYRGRDGHLHELRFDEYHDLMDHVYADIAEKAASLLTEARVTLTYE